MQTALAALRRRDRSAAQIDRYLEARGVAEGMREEALARLVRTGLVDDGRFAEIRATTLAERGAGDGLIRHDLAEAGVEGEIVAGALTALASEHERAERIVARRGADPKTARYLAGKGFTEDVVRAVIAHARDEALG